MRLLLSFWLFASFLVHPYAQSPVGDVGTSPGSFEEQVIEPLDSNQLLLNQLTATSLTDLSEIIQPNKPLRIGERMPHFSAIIAEAEVKLRADQYYVIAKWTADCADCRKNSMVIQELYAANLSDISFIGLRLSDESVTMKHSGIDYPVADLSELSDEFRNDDAAVIIITDHEGEVVDLIPKGEPNVRQSILLAIETHKRATMPVNKLLSSYRFSSQPIDSLVVDAVLPELEAEYGDQKICADKYRDKLLAALSFYPELKDVEIRVVSKEIKTSMAVRPWRFHLSRRNRSYNIYVDDITKDKPVDFRKASYSAQVGCFAHELAHIAYYEARSNVTLVGNGFGYVTSQKYRSRFEREADNITIRHGAGYYIYQFATFVLEKADISEEYREFKRNNYYGNEEILHLHREQAKKQRRKRRKVPQGE